LQCGGVAGGAGLDLLQAAPAVGRRPGVVDVVHLAAVAQGAQVHLAGGGREPGDYTKRTRDRLRPGAVPTGRPPGETGRCTVAGGPSMAGGFVNATCPTRWAVFREQVLLAHRVAAA